MSSEAKFINPFVSGAQSVLSMMLGEPPVRGPLAAESTTATSNQVNVVVGVTGDAQGTIIVGMSLTCADKIASKMIGQPIRTFDSLAASAIAELGNMICGNALTQLSQDGLICDITPPTVIRGQKVQIASTASPTIHIPFSLSYGDVTLSIALKAKESFLAA